MEEIVHPRIKGFDQWAIEGKTAFLQARYQFMRGVRERNIVFFMDQKNENMWHLDTTIDVAYMMSDMLGAFEFSARQVYYKAGYTDDQIDTFQGWGFTFGKLPEHSEDPKRQRLNSPGMFAYNFGRKNRRFDVLIDVLHQEAVYALRHNGYSRLIPIELKEYATKPLDILDLCSLAGVEEAAHSLYLAHHPQQVGEPFDAYIKRGENKAITWKRNYALRFMPDIAQGFDDSENRLEDK